MGFHCLLFAGNVKYELRHYYYTMMTLLFERGELKLSSVGFFGDRDGDGTFGIDNNTLQN